MIQPLGVLDALAERLGHNFLGQRLRSWSQRLAKSAIQNPARVGPHLFYHEGGQAAHRMILGLHEIKTVRLVSRLLRPGMAFVDAGAHLGFYTLLAARAVGRLGRVFAFEPVASTFDLLVRNIAVNGYASTVTAVCQ